MRQYPDSLEVYYRGQKIETMPRLRGESETRIDYRYIIWSLVCKPGAFARYRFREEQPRTGARTGCTAPIPYRGKSNRPAFVVEIAGRLAQETGETPEQVWQRTGENFFRLLPKAAVRN